MKLGIGTYTYMWAIGFQFGERAARPARPLTAFDLLDRARALGVHVVQFGPNLPLAGLSKADLDRLVHQAQAWGIELELGTRGLDGEPLRQQIALAQRIGATLLRTIPEIGGRPAPAAAIPDHLRALLPTLEAASVRLGLENGNLPAAELRAAIAAVGSDRVGVVLDMVNSLAVGEGWREVTRILAPFTMCLHLKDFTVQRVWSMMGFTVSGAPAGQGLVDIPWLLEALAVSPYDFNVIIELWPPEQATLEETIALEEAWAVASVARLRGYLPG